MVERRSKNIQKRVTELSISLSSFACPRRLCFCLFELFVLFEPSGNSEQCASEADPFIRAVGIIAHAICTYTTLSRFSSILSTLLFLSLSLFLSLPRSHHLHTSVFPVQPSSSTLHEYVGGCTRNDVAWAARSIDIKWSMRHSSKIHEKNMSLRIRAVCTCCDDTSDELDD